EHFNENYVESEKYPKATFQGAFKDWDNAWNDGEPHDVVATGSLDFHGVKQDRHRRHSHLERERLGHRNAFPRGVGGPRDRGSGGGQRQHRSCH
ncbi:MAG: hypothetical protein P8H88_03055, partial [Flavobacteriales bacterium]|nr:hypothetical protein [Flavobacteriales bacterium]